MMETVKCVTVFDIVIPVPTCIRLSTKTAPAPARKLKRHETSTIFCQLKKERSLSFKSNLVVKKEKEEKKPKQEDPLVIKEKIDDFLKTSRSAAMTKGSFKIPKKRRLSDVSPASQPKCEPIEAKSVRRLSAGEPTLYDGRRILGLDKQDYPPDDLVHLLSPEPLILESPYEKDDLYSVFILDEIKKAVAPYLPSMSL